MDNNNNFYEEESFGKEGGVFDAPAPTDAPVPVAVKKKKRRAFVPFIIVAVLLLGTLAFMLYPRQAGSLPEFFYKETDGGIEITGYYGENKDVIIPEEIDGISVASIGEYAFSGRDRITNIIIPDSVTSA